MSPTQLRGIFDEVEDEDRILKMINTSARKFEGAIPDDCYSEPYLTKTRLREQMKKMRSHGFFGGEMYGIIALHGQLRAVVIRHIYVGPVLQRGGVGTRLLDFALEMSGKKKVLARVWKRADWALNFFQKNGFELAGNSKELLREHWDIPDRWVEESVVLSYENKSPEQSLDEGISNRDE